MSEDLYHDALDYLYGFVNYERKMSELYTPDKMDPTRPGRLLALLDDPHTRFPTIHIAGTKGKGSVAAMCAACLRAAGLKVGLYTSPHLQDLRERIRVLTTGDAQGWISRVSFAAIVDRLRDVVPQMEAITWFELVTAAAFLHFAQEEVDVAVVEVGLGGRLDATNVLTPLVSVITSLSLEHTALLGDTLASIAAEKGGIVKPGIPVVTAPQVPEALARLRQIADERNAPLTVVGDDWQYQGATETANGAPAGETVSIIRAPFSSLVTNPAPFTFAVSLVGGHQQENAVVALAALNEVRSYFPTLTPEAVRQGMAAVSWPGRLQTIHRQPGTPTVLADGAHNDVSAAKLARALREAYAYERLWLVLGASADKNVAAIFRTLVPLAAGTIVTQADHPRAAMPEALQAQAARLGYEVQTAPDVAAAVRAAWHAARPGDLICVAGSLFVVGDLLNCWDSLQSDLLQA